jgi:hypothetical protein
VQRRGEEEGRAERGRIMRGVSRNGAGKITRRGGKRQDHLGRGAHTRARSRVLVITAGLRKCGENVGGRAYGEDLSL